MENTTMPNGTQYHTWKPEPLVRGTFSILSSSLLTMILCVWTAVHLNIPEPGGANAQMWRKTGWMTVALFAPEWVSLITLPHGWPTLTQSKVVFTAYCEHRATNDLGQTMRTAFNQPEPPGFVERLKTMELLDRLKTLEPLELLRGVGRYWGKIRQLISRYYTGFCFYMDIIDYDTYLRRMATRAAQHMDAESDLKSGRHPWTRAHSLYATMGGFVIDTRDLGLNYLPDGRQRMTLTLHGLKFIAKRAPHLVPDLPESAIVDKSKANAFTKLVTCGQALWFCVQCATRSAQGLSISLLEINTAVHAMCTLIMYFYYWWHKPLDVEEPTILTSVDAHSVIALLVAGRTYRNIRVSPMDLEDDNALDLAPDSELAIHHPNLNHVLRKPSKDPSFPPLLYVVYDGFAIPTSRSPSNKNFDDLTESDFERLKLASQAIRKYGSDTETLRPMSGSVEKDHYLTVRSRNRPISADTDSSDTDGLGAIGFLLAGLFYGAVHLLVWNRPFRNETEKLLWRISNLTILLSGTPLVVLVCYCSLPGEILERLPKQVQSAVDTMGISFFWAFSLFYISCRLFIIVECFLDVFHLPDSAFEVPQWSQYFPHV